MGNKNKQEKSKVQGRKSLSESGGRSPVLQLVVSTELKNKVMRNGSGWAREVLLNAAEKA